MKARFLSLVSVGLLLARTAACQLAPVVDDDVESELAAGKGKGKEAKGKGKWTNKTYKGVNYQCKCAPGDECWPDANQWQNLNQTVAGSLRVNLPPAVSCYNTFQGPLGNLSTYDAAKCADATANFANEQWQIDQPTAGLWTYFTGDTCRPTANPTDTCTLGWYGAYYLTATTEAHIQAGIKFAKDHNIRLIIRNTGHDFLGRSVGWGSLVINTHSFQSIKIADKWKPAPGSTYNGPYITVGAGVQAITALNRLSALSPPRVMVTGECATVGVAGGLVQGGGHGPLTNQQGFLADTALEFKAITADGKLVTANAGTNADLFWALRGGGPASFAVIVEATYKTFVDPPSSAINLDFTIADARGNMDLFWAAVTKFHSYSTAWVDAGLYVYYELFGPTLHVHPIVGINKTPAELSALVAPLLADLAALGVTYTTAAHTYPTFQALYFALFEPEAAGNSALTGGWTVARSDVVNNGTAVVRAMRAAGDAGAVLVGHMWGAGGGLPEAEWAQSAVNPRFRTAVDKLITIVPVAGNAPAAEREAAQRTLTDVVDAGLRAAAPDGCSYVNEADPFQPDWQTAFWGTNYAELLRLRKKWDGEGVFYAVSTPGTEAWSQIEDGKWLCKKA